MGACARAGGRRRRTLPAVVGRPNIRHAKGRATDWIRVFGLVGIIESASGSRPYTYIPPDDVAGRRRSDTYIPSIDVSYKKVTKLQRLQLQTVAHLKPKATHGDTCHMCKRVQQTSMDMHVHMRVRSDHITNALYKKKTLLLARRQTKME